MSTDEIGEFEEYPVSAIGTEAQDDLQPPDDPAEDGSYLDLDLDDETDGIGIDEIDETDEEVTSG